MSIREVRNKIAKDTALRAIKTMPFGKSQSIELDGKELKCDYWVYLKQGMRAMYLSINDQSKSIVVLEATKQDVNIGRYNRKESKRIIIVCGSAINNITGEILNVGDSLFIPPHQDSDITIKKGTTLNLIFIPKL